MNAIKKQRKIQIGLFFAISLLLWNSLPGGSFAQKNDETDAAVKEEKASGITMQEVSGTVVETMNSGGYTYALVDNDGIKTWVALPKSRIAVGNEIVCQPGMVMNNFSSSSLNYTFKHIVFSMGFTSSSEFPDSSEASTESDEEIRLPKIKEPENWKDF